jgi:YidC/Oxa1 family membrane protein insertase
MEKRVFSAVLISIALLFLWGAVAPKLFPEYFKKPAPPKASTESTATSAPPSSPAAAPPASATTAATTSAAPPASADAPAAAPLPPVSGAAPRIITVDGVDYVARLSNRGAELVSFQLKKFKARDGGPVELVKAREPNRTDFPFAIEAARADLTRKADSSLYDVSDSTDAKGVRVVEFRFSDGRDSVVKTFRFSPATPYLFDFAVTVTPAAAYRVVVGPGIRTLDKEEKDNQFIITGNGVVQRDDDFKSIRREKAGNLTPFDHVQFIGVEDNYFLSVLKPVKADGAVLRAIDVPVPGSTKNEKRREIYAGLNDTPEGVVAGQAYFGPKETKIVDAYGLEKTLQFGMFGIIGRFFLIALTWINRYTHNYGFAIIVLTILIKIVLYPLQHKWIVSMKKMQKLQPKMEAIKARYKKSKTDAEQRQKMNTEMMALYQKEGINPAGGCLPFVIQLPILWGFYNLLTHAIELRGAPFILWIHDLSMKDPYYITPALMTITMFIQQMMTPTTGDPAQRRMFMIMPLVMGWIFKEFPAGVVLYWLMQNLLTILQQWIMNKYWKEHPTELQQES